LIQIVSLLLHKKLGPKMNTAVPVRP